MNIIFTPASILELLNQIDELKDYQLGISETIDGKLQLVVGDSTYEIDTENTKEVSVSEEVADSVEEINQEAYNDLVEDSKFIDESEFETIESGIIKEAIKSLLLGGAIKLVTKLLK